MVELYSNVSRVEAFQVAFEIVQSCVVLSGVRSYAVVERMRIKRVEFAQLPVLEGERVRLYARILVARVAYDSLEMLSGSRDAYKCPCLWKVEINEDLRVLGVKTNRLDRLGTAPGLKKLEKGLARLFRVKDSRFSRERKIIFF